MKEYIMKLKYQLMLFVVVSTATIVILCLYQVKSNNKQELPSPTSILKVSKPYDPLVLAGIKVDRENPFKFDFVIDKGDWKGTEENLKNETQKIINYFLAALSMPKESLWVNLSPYEKERVIEPELSGTEIGRDMLIEDYKLKLLTSSLTHPETKLGKEYWEKNGANSFKKVWITPSKSRILENKYSAFIKDATLKVMSEKDYIAYKKQENIKNFVGSNDKLNKEILNAISCDVNRGKNFSSLRQMYRATLLAIWYKKQFKNTFFYKIYADKKNVNGIDVSEQYWKDKIYKNYLTAFDKGVYDLLKREIDPVTNKTFNRRFFSGGLFLDQGDTIEYQPFSSSSLSELNNKKYIFVTGSVSSSMESHNSAVNPRIQLALTQLDNIDSPRRQIKPNLPRDWYKKPVKLRIDSDKVRKVHEEINIITKTIFEDYPEFKGKIFHGVKSFYMDGFVEALDYFVGFMQKEEISPEILEANLIKFHDILYSSDPSGYGGGEYVCGNCTRQEVLDLMSYILSDEAYEMMKQDPLRLAAIVFIQLVSYQAFEDGNHRAGMLPLNFVLIKSGLSPFYLNKSNIIEYYRLLNTGDLIKDEYNVEKVMKFLKEQIYDQSSFYIIEGQEKSIKEKTDKYRGSSSSSLSLEDQWFNKPIDVSVNRLKMKHTNEALSEFSKTFLDQYKEFQGVVPHGVKTFKIKKFEKAIDHMLDFLQKSSIDEFIFEKAFIKFNEILHEDEDELGGSVYSAGPEVRKTILNSIRYMLSTKGKEALERDPVYFASDLFAQLVKLQPFEDGNHRSALFILNFVLFKTGLPPFVLTEDNFVEYYSYFNREYLGDKNSFNLEDIADFIYDQISTQDHYYNIEGYDESVINHLYDRPYEEMASSSAINGGIDFSAKDIIVKKDVKKKAIESRNNILKFSFKILNYYQETEDQNLKNFYLR